MQPSLAVALRGRKKIGGKKKKKKERVGALQFHYTGNIQQPSSA